jgi:hypothetical protein
MKSKEFVVVYAVILEEYKFGCTSFNGEEKYGPTGPGLF